MDFSCPSKQFVGRVEGWFFGRLQTNIVNSPAAKRFCLLGQSQSFWHTYYPSEFGQLLLAFFFFGGGMHVIKFTIIIADMLSYKQSWQLRKLFEMQTESC